MRRGSNGFDDHPTCTCWCFRTLKVRRPRRYSCSSASLSQINADRDEQFVAPQKTCRISVLVLVVAI